MTRSRTPENRPYLDRCLRGSNGYKAEERVKLLKLLDRLRDLARPESDVMGNILETSRLPQRVRKSVHDELDRL